MMTEEKIVDQSIEHYELEQLVGQDALADTYLAYDPESNRNVLINILSGGYAEDDDYRSSYVNRAYTLSQIRHPNIATIYNSGETSENRPYIVSEQIEGFPLADRLHRLAQQQSPAHAIYALTLVRQIASGLSFAERLGYFHYELTPRHILLRNVTLKTDDSVVLVNLDISPKLGLSSESSNDSYLACYLSPEQLSNKEIDGRSHVYSLGIILFQLLTGKLPDQNRPNWQRLLRTMSIAGTPLQQLRGDLSPETYDLVEKSLRIKPGSRSGSMGKFVSALDEALAAEDLRIHTSDLAEPRRPRPIYLAPLLLLLVCVSLAAAIWWFNPGNLATESQTTANDDNPSGMIVGAMRASPSPTSTSSKRSNSATPTVETTSIDSAATSRMVTTTLPASEAQPTALASVTSTLTSEAPPSITPSKLPPTIKAPIATEIVPTPWPEYRISVSSTSLRRGPGSRFDVGSYLLQGERVVIIGKTNGIDIWYVVKTADGRVGWISASVGESAGLTDLDSVMEAATIPPPPPTYTPTPTNTPVPTGTPTSPSTGGGGNKDPGDKPKTTPTPPL
jgi:serine/threonine protein kinase